MQPAAAIFSLLDQPLRLVAAHDDDVFLGCDLSQQFSHMAIVLVLRHAIDVLQADQHDIDLVPLSASARFP